MAKSLREIRSDNARPAEGFVMQAGGMNPACRSLNVLSHPSFEGETSIFAFLAHFADVMLRVKLEAKLADEIDLGFEEIDVVFFIRHQLLEQIACYVILDGVTMRCSFLVELPGRHLRSEIAVQHLFHVLSDVQRVKHLHVGETIEKNDALDQLVGMLHLLDRFL